MTEEKNNKEINQDVLRWIIIGLVGFALIALIFSAGMKVGASKAKYSYPVSGLSIDNSYSNSPSTLFQLNSPTGNSRHLNPLNHKLSLSK
jgi:hypothetical protein